MNVALSALMGTVFGTRLPVIEKIQNEFFWHASDLQRLSLMPLSRLIKLGNESSPLLASRAHVLPVAGAHSIKSESRYTAT